MHFKNWLCTNHVTDRATSAGKRWNKLACKPERGRARSLRETADGTHQGEIEDMLVCKLLPLDTWNHLWISISGMLGKDRPYRPAWAWLLHHWGFGWAPSAWGRVKTWQKWWGWGHRERKQWNGWWEKLSPLVSGTTAAHQTHMTSSTEEVRSGE